jgi:hypothetical protein
VFNHAGLASGAKYFLNPSKRTLSVGTTCLRVASGAEYVERADKVEKVYWNTTGPAGRAGAGNAGTLMIRRDG